MSGDVVGVGKFVSDLALLARCQLPIVAKITRDTHKLTRAAGQEERRLESIGGSVKSTPEFISPDTASLCKGVEAAKARILQSPEFVRLSGDQSTLLIRDAALDEIKDALYQGLIDLSDLEALLVYYTHANGYLLERIKKMVDLPGTTDQSVLKAFAQRSDNVSQATSFIACLIASKRYGL